MVHPLQLHGDPGGGALAALEPLLPAIQRAYTAEPSAVSTPSGDCAMSKEPASLHLLDSADMQHLL